MAIVLPATFQTTEVEVTPSDFLLNGGQSFSLKVGKPGDRLVVALTIDEFRTLIAKGSALLSEHDAANLAPIQAVA